MATLLVQTDVDTAVLQAFVKKAIECGHLGTGWTNPILNPMIRITGIEISDFGPSGEQ